MFSTLEPKTRTNNSVRPITIILYTIAKLKTWFAKIPRGKSIWPLAHGLILILAVFSTVALTRVW